MSEVLDLDKLGTSLADEGVEMQVIHPVKGEPIEGMFLKLAGTDSEVCRKAQRKTTNMFLKQRHSGRNQAVTQEELEKDSLDLLVAVTMGWRGEQWKLNGEPLPFSPENARKLYEDRRYAWLVRQARLFFTTESNFIPA